MKTSLKTKRWLHVIIMSRTCFTVYLHSTVALDVKELLGGNRREVWVTVTGFNIWLNSWVFIYELSGFGFESRCCHKINIKNFLDPRQESSQPTFQRRINVVSTLWINVKITLIRRWKWNKIRRRIFNVAQRWYNVSARRWNNVETTLHNVETTLHNVGTTLIQRCFNLASTLVKPILNPIGLVMIVDCEIVEYMLNTWIVFILLNEKTFFYYILTIQLLMKYLKIFQQWYI